MSAHPDLRRAAIAAVLCGGLALLIPVAFLSLLLLAPLAFFLPGYAIASATLIRTAPDWPRLLVISLGLSLAVLAIGGLPLNYLGGLTPASWTLLLVLVTLAACWTAAARRPAGWANPHPWPRLGRPSPLTVALGTAGLLTVAVAVALAFVPLSAKHAVGFTELWLRPYASGTQAGVRVGVGNQQKETTSYMVKTKFGGARPAVESEVRVDPGDTTVLSVAATPPPLGAEPLFVRVVLFRAVEPERPYRRVYGWIPPLGGESP